MADQRETDQSNRQFRVTMATTARRIQGSTLLVWGTRQAMAEGHQSPALLDPAPPGFPMIGRYRRLK
jgi:hypothetical protein